jgi:hypothetical protein
MTPSSSTFIRDPWRRLWHFFAGDGLLAAALILTAALLIAAALLPQTPANDLVAYSRWLSEAQLRFGSLYLALNALSLFGVTHSVVLRLALALLGLSAALRLIDQADRLRHPAISRQPAATRSDSALLLAYAGVLAMLLGLLLGVFVDRRSDRIVVSPQSPAAVPGTAYALRLDEVNDETARVAVLRQTETVAQGIIAPRQPLAADLNVYLDRIGPALTVSAARDSSRPIGLQSTAASPTQTQVLLLFTPDQNEGFVAAPEINLVLRISPAGARQYAAQAYQTATGKDLGRQIFEPGNRLTVDGATFTFEPAAYVTVSVASQPSHWIILIGLALSVAGLIGVLIWPEQAPTKRSGRVLLLLLRVCWPLLTLWLAASIISIYPRLASLGEGPQQAMMQMGLAAWLLVSGSALTQPRPRALLLALGLIAAAGAIGVGLSRMG